MESSLWARTRAKTGAPGNHSHFSGVVQFAEDTGRDDLLLCIPPAEQKERKVLVLTSRVVLNWSVGAWNIERAPFCTPTVEPSAHSADLYSRAHPAKTPKEYTNSTLGKPTKPITPPYRRRTPSVPFPAALSAKPSIADTPRQKQWCKQP
jgi:hypothetical protein